MEEVWQVMRRLKLVEEESVHLAHWPVLEHQVDRRLQDTWERFLAVREVVMKALEEQRIAQVIGSPLEAHVTLIAQDKELGRLLEEHRQTLAEAFVVSEVCVANADTAQGVEGELGSSVPGLAQVKVERAPGTKCQRCWKYSSTVGASSEYPPLCARCVGVLSSSHG